MKQLNHFYHKTVNFFIKFGMGACIVFLSHACGNNKTDQTETNNQASAATEQSILNAQKEAYFHSIQDSALTASNYFVYEAQLNSVPKYFDDERRVNDLLYSQTLGGTLEKEVIDAGTKIFNQCNQEIAQELKKYQIDFNINDKDEDGFFDIYDTTMMIFIDPKITDEVYYFSPEYFWNAFTKDIFELINKSSYGTGPKENMKKNISNIIEKTKKALIVSRKSIESKYTEYINTPEDYILGWACEEGDFYPDYESLNEPYVNGKYVVTNKYISVYDSKLSVDFFGDPEAEYTLVSLGNNKWQAVKKYKSGKIEKTAVFTDAGKISTFQDARDEKPSDKSSFDFRPGQNMGVHIDYREISDVKTRKKDWSQKIPTNVQKTVDSLNQEIDRKKTLEIKQSERKAEASRIAHQKTIERFGSDYQY